MKTILVLVTLAATVLALPPADTHVVHQRRDEVRTARFVKREAVAATTNIPFEIALKQGNLKEAEERLYDISDPLSRNYGKHLSKADVVKLFAVDDTAISSVKKWLVQAGVDEKTISVNPTKTWIRVNAPASVLEKALKTKYHVYRSDTSAHDHVGADDYSLPNDIADIVDFVRPGVSPIKLNTRAKQPPTAIKEPLRKLTDDQTKTIKTAILAGPRVTGTLTKLGNSTLPDYLKICSKYVTPDCIAYSYRIPVATESNVTNPLGMFESGNVYAQEDLDVFFASVAPYIPQGTGPDLDLIDGATAPTSVDQSGGESTLDFDMVYPIIYPQKTTLFQVKPDQYYNIFGDYLSAIDSDYCSQDPLYNEHKMCGTFQPTNVISVSYGGPEDPTSPKDAHRQCNEFLKLGLLGVTAVIASGDAGVTDRAGYCQGPHHDIFIADDLCGCPYVTCVGSTAIHQVDQPETATETFSSGGGFSNIFARPSWQDFSIGNYLLRHNPGYFAYNTSEGVIPITGGIYNRGGRGFPDVAAVGDNGVVVSNGILQTTGGTSMSAPIVAAIINRINDKRLSVGKGPIGFANIGLYQAEQDHRKHAQNPNLFNDVTVGDQALGGYGDDRGYSACGKKGFSAAPGWDPVTGLGTPIYPQWEKYFLAH